MHGKCLEVFRSSSLSCPSIPWCAQIVRERQLVVETPFALIKCIYSIQNMEKENVCMIEVTLALLHHQLQRHSLQLLIFSQLKREQYSQGNSDWCNISSLSDQLFCSTLTNMTKMTDSSFEHEFRRKHTNKTLQPWIFYGHIPPLLFSLPRKSNPLDIPSSITDFHFLCWKQGIEKQVHHTVIAKRKQTKITCQVPVKQAVIYILD